MASLFMSDRLADHSPLGAETGCSSGSAAETQALELNQQSARDQDCSTGDQRKDPQQ